MSLFCSNGSRSQLIMYAYAGLCLVHTKLDLKQDISLYMVIQLYQGDLQNKL